MSFKTYNKITKTSKFYSEITYFFEISFFFMYNKGYVIKSKSIHNAIFLIGTSYIKKTPLRRMRDLWPLKSNNNRSVSGDQKMYT